MPSGRGRLTCPGTSGTPCSLMKFGCGWGLGLESKVDDIFLQTKGTSWHMSLFFFDIFFLPPELPMLSVFVFWFKNNNLHAGQICGLSLTLSSRGMIKLPSHRCILHQEQPPEMCRRRTYYSWVVLNFFSFHPFLRSWWHLWIFSPEIVNRETYT